MTTASPAGPAVGQSGISPAIDAVLADSPLLRSLDVEQRRRVLALGDVRELGPGEAVMRQGEQSPFVFVLLDGGAEVLVRGADSRSPTTTCTSWWIPSCGCRGCPRRRRWPPSP